jgi:CubicO group peptidase (beta-lactamase class C family)
VLGTEIDAAALAEVERRFREQLSPLRLFPGGAIAVYCRGRLDLDLAGGYADTQRGEPVGPQTLFPLFSGTKPFAAVALWQQIERGRIGLDDPVAAYWPAFGQNGKDRVLVRHILSHRGGFPTTPPELTPDRWGDWEAAMRAVAAMPLDHQPGAVSAYHFLTQHWVCAELVRRLDGRAYQDYLREEITGPLGLSDTYVGLPVAFEHRVAKLHATDGTDEWGLGALRTMSGLRMHRLVIPGGSGVSTARDMARFYAAIAAGGALDGGRVLRAETVERMLTIEVDDEMDPTFDVPVRRGLGFELGGLADPRRHWPGATSTARTFWHGGFGSSVCWGDPDLDLAMAFMTNGVRRDEAGAAARRDLSDAVRVGCR